MLVKRLALGDLFDDRKYLSDEEIKMKVCLNGWRLRLHGKLGRLRQGYRAASSIRIRSNRAAYGVENADFGDRIVRRNLTSPIINLAS